MLSQGEPRDAAVNFYRYRILQWHRAVFTATARLSHYSHSIELSFQPTQVIVDFEEAPAATIRNVFRVTWLYPVVGFIVTRLLSSAYVNWVSLTRTDTTTRQTAFSCSCYLCHCCQPVTLWLPFNTRKLSYRRDDRAMRPIYGCPENFRETLRARLLFPKFLMGVCSD